jgi:hypothetical protein
MKLALLVGGVIIAVALLVVIVGLALPKSHVAARQAVLNAPPDAVFLAVTEVEHFPAWRRGVKKVERLPDRNGRPMWIEDGTTGRMTLAIERMERPRLVVTKIADPNLPFGGTWTYDLRPAADGCVVTITENGEIYNPVFRFMARFVFGYEATMAGYLDALVAKFGGGQQRPAAMPTGD